MRWLFVELPKSSSMISFVLCDVANFLNVRAFFSFLSSSPFFILSGEGAVFSSVCLSTLGVPQSQIPSGGYPSPGWRVPQSFLGGTPGQGPPWPPDQTGLGTPPPNQVRMGYPPPGDRTAEWALTQENFLINS